MATISSTFKMQDNATKTLRNVAASIDNVAEKANRANNNASNMRNPLDNAEVGFSKWESKIISINKLLILYKMRWIKAGKVPL